MSIDFKRYPASEFFDETLANSNRSRPHAKDLVQLLRSMDDDGSSRRARPPPNSPSRRWASPFRSMPRGRRGTIDRAWPFDILPRIIPRRRVGPRRGRPHPARAGAEHVHRRHLPRAAHRDRRCVSGRGARRVEELSRAVRRCLATARRVGAHLRFGPRPRRDGTVYVLEDNLRVPSGVSYMLENRLVTKRVFPELFERYAPLPVDDYTAHLLADAVRSVAQAHQPAGGRRAHARHLQLRLLRACLPRPGDGLRAGGGSRPVRRR